MKEIILTKGLSTILDEEDYDKLSVYKWYALGSIGRPYAARGIWCPSEKVVKSVYMHRLICISNKLVDHINGDTLDNRRINLRPASISQNVRNRVTRGTSVYMGVSRHLGKTWIAKIVIDGKQKHIGCFKEEKMAAKAYNDAAIKYGVSDFCRLNNVC